MREFNLDLFEAWDELDTMQDITDIDIITGENAKRRIHEYLYYPEKGIIVDNELTGLSFTPLTDIANVKEIPGIYLIRNIQSNQIYIGQSDNLRRRLHEHSNCKRKNYHKDSPFLHAAILRYKLDYFEYSILVTHSEIRETDDLEKVLNSEEISYIDKYNSFKNKANYNLNPGGERYYKTRFSEKVILDIYDALKNTADTEETIASNVSEASGEQVSRDIVSDVNTGARFVYKAIIYRHTKEWPNSTNTVRSKAMQKKVRAQSDMNQFDIKIGLYPADVYKNIADINADSRYEATTLYNLADKIYKNKKDKNEIDVTTYKLSRERENIKRIMIGSTASNKRKNPKTIEVDGKNYWIKEIEEDNMNKDINELNLDFPNIAADGRVVTESLTQVDKKKILRAIDSYVDSLQYSQMPIDIGDNSVQPAPDVTQDTVNKFISLVIKNHPEYNRAELNKLFWDFCNGEEVANYDFISDDELEAELEDLLGTC